jgi:HSP20 family protein
MTLVFIIVKGSIKAAFIMVTTQGRMVYNHLNRSPRFLGDQAMAILRWDSTREVMFVQDKMQKLFEYALANLDVDIRIPAPWTPACDVYESPTSFILKAEVPGMSLEDIALEVSSNSVTLVGVRKRQREVSEENYHRMERNYGKFIRNFILPFSVDENSVSASLKDGLLTVTIPKAATINGGSTVRVEGE